MLCVVCVVCCVCVVFHVTLSDPHRAYTVAWWTSCSAIDKKNTRKPPDREEKDRTLCRALSTFFASVMNFWKV